MLRMSKKLRAVLTLLAIPHLLVQVTQTRQKIVKVTISMQIRRKTAAKAVSVAIAIVMLTHQTWIVKVVIGGPIRCIRQTLEAAM